MIQAITDKPAHILNIAHRGVRAYAPENTLPAFAKAKIFGCDMFELDAMLSQDEIVIVHHDDHLKRCTNAESVFPGRNNYAVENFTYQELSQLDAGSWYCEELEKPNSERHAFLHSLSDAEMLEFVSQTDRGEYMSGRVKIPTLKESLELAKDLDLMVNVELKSGSEKDKLLVLKAVKIIEEMNMEAKVLISSFYLELIKQARQYNKRIATAALTEKPLEAPLTSLHKLKANACNLGCYSDFKISGFDSKGGKQYLTHLKKITDAGYGLNIWTCNNPDEMAALLQGGVTGLITDYPNRAKEVIMEYLTQQNTLPAA